MSLYQPFDINNYNNILGSPTTTSPSTASTTGIFTCSKSAKAEFMKGIKRDITSFPMLKSEEHWDSWNHTMHAVARTQDVAVVLDNNYTPTTSDDIELFQAKQEYMYTVFECTVQISKGKDLVRQHETDFDAQTLYADLLDYLKHSTKGLLAAADILAYLTSARLTPDHWKGTAHDCLLHWKDQMRQYENLVDSADHLTGNVKRTLLESSVHPLNELCHVKAESDQHYTRTGTALTFEQYESLLISAAITYDEKFKHHHTVFKKECFCT